MKREENSPVPFPTACRPASGPRASKSSFISSAHKNGGCEHLNATTAATNQQQPFQLRRRRIFVRRAYSSSPEGDLFTVNTTASGRGGERSAEASARVIKALQQQLLTARAGTPRAGSRRFGGGARRGLPSAASVFFCAAAPSRERKLATN